MFYADDEVKYRFFQQSRGRNSNTNNWIWPCLPPPPTSLPPPPHTHTHTQTHTYTHPFICMFQEHPIKTEWVVLITESNRSFFQHSRRCNSKIKDSIWPVLKLYFAISFMSTLSASFREIESRLNMLQSQTETYSKYKDVILRLII